MSEEIYSYDKYIIGSSDFYGNPLYLHNSEENYKKTLSNITQINMLQTNYLEGRMKRYLNYLEEQENLIINQLGGEDKLQMILDDIGVRNKNIENIYNILNEVFPTKLNESGIKRHTFSIGKNGPQFGINNQQLKVLLNETGQIIGISDTDANLKKFEKNFKIYVDYMNSLYEKKQEYDEVLKECLNLGVITSKVGNTPIKTLINYLNDFKIKKGVSADYLEALRGTSNVLSVLTGQFDEGLQISFSTNTINAIQSTFNEINKDNNKKVELHVERVDQLISGKNKKPDLVVYGNVIPIDIAPLTISKKSTTKSDIHLQGSALMSSRDEGMYEYFNNEIPNLGNYYVYLTLNNAYFDDNKAKEIINNLNQFLSYIFISGNFKDSDSNNSKTNLGRALFFMVTKRSGAIVKEVKIVPIKDILAQIFMDRNKIKITSYDGNKSDLEKLLEKKHEAFKNNKDSFFSEYNYEFLARNSEIKRFLRSNLSFHKVIEGPRDVKISFGNIKRIDYEDFKEKFLEVK